MTWVDVPRKIISMFIWSFESMCLFGKHKYFCRELVTWRHSLESPVEVSRRKSSDFAIKSNLVEMICLINWPIKFPMGCGWTCGLELTLELAVEEYFFGKCGLGCKTVGNWTAYLWRCLLAEVGWHSVRISGLLETEQTLFLHHH